MISLPFRYGATGSGTGSATGAEGTAREARIRQLLKDSGTRLVGPSTAKDMLFSARFLEADEALRIGLVNRLVDDGELEAAVTALADKIAGQPPIAVRGSKRAIDQACRQSLGEGLREAAVGQAECIRSADFVEAMKANLEKRAPQYKNA